MLRHAHDHPDWARRGGQRASKPCVGAGDEDGSTDWFPATIVHWPTNSEHDRLLMHFEDSMDKIITLPDDTVRLTGEAVVARCKCARCAVRPEAEDGGCTLPLPQPARPRRRS